MTDRKNDEYLLTQPEYDEDKEHQKIHETIEGLGEETFYNTPQAAELINVPHTTLRGWFIELEETYGVHSLPRNSRGRRIFRKEDIEIALAIKQMRERNLTFEVIVELLKKRFGDKLMFNPYYAPSRVSERERNYYEQLTRLFRDEFFNFMEEIQFESEKRISSELNNIQRMIQNSLSNDRESLNIALEKWKMDIETKIREEYDKEQQKLLERIQDILDEKAKDYKEREQKLMQKINQLVDEKEKRGGFFSRLFGKGGK